MSDLLSFAIDEETRDLVFDAKNRLAMVDGIDANRQRVRLRLGCHTREWFLDTFLGVPWMKLVEKGVSRERIRAEVLKALMADGEIERVEELRIGALSADRTLPIDFVARLRSGQQLADRVEVTL